MLCFYSLINGTDIPYPVVPLPTSDFEIVDFDNDGVTEMKVKFDRQDVIEAITATIGVPETTTSVTLHINGDLLDGLTSFYGNEKINVTNRKEQKVKVAKTKKVTISAPQKGGKNGRGKGYMSDKAFNLGTAKIARVIGEAIDDVIRMVW